MPDWPLTSYLGPLGALPTAPRLARGFVVQVLTSWGLTESLDVLELIASELATNVVRAATDADGTPRYDFDLEQGIPMPPDSRGRRPAY